MNKQQEKLLKKLAEIELKEESFLVEEANTLTQYERRSQLVQKKRNYQTSNLISSCSTILHRKAWEKRHTFGIYRRIRVSVK